MSKISLKKDYTDGKVLYSSDLNMNNEVIELGVNDNFTKIQELANTKADKAELTEDLSNKVDTDKFNEEISNLKLVKANKTDVNGKANLSDVYTKQETYNLINDATKDIVNKSYIDNKLDTKADKVDVESKFDKSQAGDINKLNTTDKTSLVNAINSLNRETAPIATLETVGVVKPDGTTTTIDQDGTIHAVGGGGGGSGTSDYNALSNKPQINSIEISGNKSLEDLGIASIESVNEKIDKMDVYTKSQVDTEIENAISDKTTKTYVDTQLGFKANTSDIYTRSYIDNKFETQTSDINSVLNTKANKSDTYTKSETDKEIKDYVDSAIGVPEEVYIGETSDAPEGTKIVIDNNYLNNIGTEVVDTLDGNESYLAPSVRAVNKAFVDYNLESKTTSSTSWENANFLSKFVSSKIEAFEITDGKLKCLKTGVYSISANIYWEDTKNTSGTRINYRIVKNDDLGSSSLTYTSTQNRYLPINGYCEVDYCEILVDLIEGDILQFQIKTEQTSGIKMSGRNHFVIREV